jgi:hypothetical protein
MQASAQSPLLSLLYLPLDILRLLVNKYLNIVDVFVLRCCCRKSQAVTSFDLSLIRLQVLKKMAECGYIVLINWYLKRHHIRLGKEAFNKDVICSAAAAYPDHQIALDMLKLLIEKGAKPGKETAKQIGIRGSVEMIQLYGKEPLEKYAEILLEHAAGNNRIAIVDLFHDNLNSKSISSFSLRGK